MTGPGSKLARLKRGFLPGVPQPQAPADAAGTLAKRGASPAGPAQARSNGSGPLRLSEVGHGSSLNLVGAGIAGAATLAATVLVTQGFSKADAGTFFTATSAFLIIESLGGLGASVGLVYFVARLRSLGHEARIGAILRAAVIPVVVVSVVAMAAMLLFAKPLAHLLLAGHLGHRALGPGAVADMLRSLALVVPFAALIDTWLGATRGHHDMRPTVVIDRTVVPVAQLLGVLAAVAAGSTAVLAPLWAVPYVPGAVVAWLWLRHIRHGSRPRRPVLPDVPPELAALMTLATPVHQGNGAAFAGPPRAAQGAFPVGSRVARKRLGEANPAAFWRFTLPRGAANLASNIIQRIDIVLVAILRNPAEAAVYTAATRFLVAGQFGGMAINRAAQPRLTELFTVRDQRGTNTVYQVTTAWLVLLTWPLYLLAIVYGPQVMAIFGRSYQAGDAVMVILAIAMLVGTAFGQVDVMLITSGRSSWSLANSVLVLGTNVGLDLLLIPRYGIAGAAVGWAVAIFVSNIVPYIQLAVVCKLTPFARESFIACLVTAVSFGVVPYALRTALGDGAVGIAAGLLAGCTLQAAGMWRYRRVLRLSMMPGLAFLGARRRTGPAARARSGAGS